MEIDSKAKLTAEKYQLFYVMSHSLYYFIHFKFRAT